MSLVEVFETVDKNKDGKISCDEFVEAIRVFTSSITSEELENMFRVLDLDGDGQIDIEEFALGVVLGNVNVETALKQTFDSYDMDGDGKISASDIHFVLNRQGKNHTMEECVAMVQAVDADGDGFVDFEEFKTMIISN
ncbi:PREDICTED: probable calcium-binding protein CML32 [Camelina sativa]|uniref:Probable calcium-binding protein CML32 n=1 Tax=Camelina sativa TaxID=90675 RepID=A0ABM0Y4C1_CAMSA|nr:PREDICTED: probable calcium-binding protein CML32 [Camelina sativa]